MPDSPLAVIEPRLRPLLPARLYAAAWVRPDADNLTQVFNHLRTFQYVLHDYVPRRVLMTPPVPGEIRHQWQEGALMFTDLAGFTTLLEANANRGHEAAILLLGLLNTYFAAMIEIISKSGGTLLEFTGDALLALFPTQPRSNETAQAVRAGLRMQRAMLQFERIELDVGTFSLKMRVGIHTGRFVMADIGTPFRMEHVLLGREVHQAKMAESTGQVDRVNLSDKAYEKVRELFRFDPGQPGHWLVRDDLSDEALGEYEVPRIQRRMGTSLLLDRSVPGLVRTIDQSLQQLEPLACYLPGAVRRLLIETATVRRIPPDCPTPVVMFISLLGLPEAVDEAGPDEVDAIIATFSAIFAQINAVVEALDGVLKKVTYHLSGSDIVIYFGVPGAHTDDPVRAARAALAIRDVVAQSEAPVIDGRQLDIQCKIGLNQGFTFVGEIGEPRGRREYNVLGDTVNTAARLMNRAEPGQILMSGSVYHALPAHFHAESQGAIALKGKAAPTEIYALHADSDIH